MKIFGGNHAKVYRVFERWRDLQQRYLNMEIETEGDIPEHGAIIMANHRSYLDVIMIPSLTPVVFVAKASVEKWPVIGMGGNAMQTIWVDRSDPDSRKATRKEIVRRLEDDLSVIIFPEGTTHLGPDLLEFKPGMFHSVAGTSLPIIPVAIEYENPNIAWVGQDTFIPHFLREFKIESIRAKVAFGAPMTGEDPEKLRQEVQEWIAAKCLQYREAYDSRISKGSE